jgi:2,4-dienoyl-CoA reductase-like NADH-dependent reductase (Old Yellow Enzyme family)
MDLSPLFKPLTLGALELRNRIAMAPMTRSFSPEGVPTAEVAAYYGRRAAGGVGLIITEGTAIDHPSAPGYPDVPHMYGEDAVHGWHRVARLVHDHKAKIICQLWHVGGVRAPGFDRKETIPRVGPSEVKHPGNVSRLGPAHALTEEEIQDIIDGFARSARHAQDAGLDGVELHGAHGYLIDQFFWPTTNERTDKWGETKNLFATELVKAVRKAVHKEFLISFRFSQWKIRAFDAKLVETPEQLEQLIAPIGEAGVDVWHASNYNFDTPEFDGSTLNLAGWAKKLTGIPAMTVGKIGVDTSFAEEKRGTSATKELKLGALTERLKNNEFDLFAVGRALLGDPEWPNKLQAGDLEAIQPYSQALLKELK